MHRGNDRGTAVAVDKPSNIRLIWDCVYLTVLAGARVALFGIDICSLPCAVWMSKRATKQSKKDSDDRDEGGDGSRYYAAEQERAQKLCYTKQHRTNTMRRGTR